MAEKGLFFARAVVYYFDSAQKKWAPTPVGNGFSRVDMYENPSTGSYRVIGRGLQDTSKVVINSNVTKELSYQRASATFGQWSDGRYVYGLNFASQEEAETFGSGFEGIVQKLKGGGGAPTPAPPAKPASGPPAPPSGGPPAPPSGGPPARKPEPSSDDSGGPPPPPGGGPPPPPSGGPPPPKAPPVKVGGGDPVEGRGALLSSITGFSKGGLKKAQTVDKSVPILTEKPAASSSSGGGGGATGGSSSGSSGSSGGGGMGGMMAEILAKRAKMGSSDAPKSTPAPRNEPAATPAKPTPPTPTSKATLTPSKPTPSTPTPTPPTPANKGTLKASTSTLSTSPSSSTQSILPADLAALKDEILLEVRKELASMKDEILAAINSR